MYLVLIDTWWNVNLLLLYRLAVMNRVLIDTWWNVNHGHLRCYSVTQTVLIDTWWNVNLGSGSQIGEQIAF